MNTAKWLLLSAFGIFVGLMAIGFMIPDGQGIAQNPPLDPVLTEQLPPLIRTMGLRCGTLNTMKLRAKTERGDVFMATCDEATSYYRYRILYTPSGQMTIRPWSE